MLKLLLLTLLAALVLLFGCKEEKKPDTTEIETVAVATTFTDERDGNVYKYVKIGEQVWMAENLNFEAENSRCYDDYPTNCKIYGRLYDWETALKVCPDGWHLPKNEEWDVLYKYVDSSYETKYGKEHSGDSKTAGKYLKAKVGWNENGESANGTDEYGFAALPGGNGGTDDYFYHIGYRGDWWTASEYSATTAYCRYMSSMSRSKESNESAYWYNHYKTTNWHSVRCIQD